MSQLQHAIAAAVAELQKTASRLEAAAHPTHSVNGYQEVTRSASPADNEGDSVKLIALVDRMNHAHASRLDCEARRRKLQEEADALARERDAYHDEEMRCRTGILEVAERRGLQARRVLQARRGRPGGDR